MISGLRASSRLSSEGQTRTVPLTVLSAPWTSSYGSQSPLIASDNRPSQSPITRPETAASGSAEHLKQGLMVVRSRAEQRNRLGWPSHVEPRPTVECREAHAALDRD